MISDDERRARLALRHGLTPQARCADPVMLGGALDGLHATDPATVSLSARAHLEQSSVADIAAALYEQRALRQIRRTMVVLPADLAPVVQASSTRALVPGERRRFAALLKTGGGTPPEHKLCGAASA